MKKFFNKIFKGFQKEAHIPAPKEEQPQREVTASDLKDFDRFEQEMQRLIIRYYSDPKASLKLNFETDKNEKVPPAVVFGQRFEEWREANTAWDKKSVIFKLFDQLFRDKLKFWQLGERFIEDRFADDAYSLMVKMIPPKKRPERFIATLAKSMVVLGRYDEAVKKAMQALEASRDYRPAQLTLADALYLSGDIERAVSFYNEIAAQTLDNRKSNGNSKVSAIDLLGFEGQKMRSPIYALLFLKEFPVTEGIWKWAEIEFYYSPQFRREYAIALIKSGDKMRGFSKLLDVSKEMPWARLPALNALECFEHLDPKGEKQLLVAERKQLKEHIAAKKWKLDEEEAIGELLG